MTTPLAKISLGLSLAKNNEISCAWPLAPWGVNETPITLSSLDLNFGMAEKITLDEGKLSNVSYLDTIDVRVHTDEDLESLQKDSVGANKHLVTLTCWWYPIVHICPTIGRSGTFLLKVSTNKWKSLSKINRNIQLLLVKVDRNPCVDTLICDTLHSICKYQINLDVQVDFGSPIPLSVQRELLLTVSCFMSRMTLRLECVNVIVVESADMPITLSITWVMHSASYIVIIGSQVEIL